jgi:capsid protein
VRQEFLTGRIGGGYSATQYQNNPWYYNQCFWLPEGEDWVDPLKDAQALVLAYKSGWMTLQSICALKGLDWQSVLTQRKIEKEFLVKEGLQELLPAFEGAIDAQNNTDDNQDEEEAPASKNIARKYSATGGNNEF